ncbi:Digalactosyldiacylglycerol synthase 1, chloroplastic [Senna tora]|uniref:digalactosyldiacylglycerol synthase n=1 Tax=Senna tora TaxID=362788 RepID=A0A834X7A2_9FABA|nr:Digalactosyldiacylglycerol synthase 1, chloroplastic [Senna tora]
MKHQRKKDDLEAELNKDLNLNFEKGRDQADDSLHGYKVFINPSISDVLCTATAEALAMGKFVVCADHPSNEFFMSFPNCLTYKTSEDFVEKVKEALANEPYPLTPEERYQLLLEAATQRFMEYSELDKVLNKENDGVKSSTGNRKLIASDELERHGDYFVNLTIQLLTAFKKDLEPWITRIGTYVDNLKILSQRLGMSSRADNEMAVLCSTGEIFQASPRTKEWAIISLR